MVQEKNSRLRSEAEELNRVAPKVFASHCTFGLYILKLRLLVYLEDHVESFESMVHTDAALFEHFGVLNKQSYRLTSQWLSTKGQETVQNIKNAVYTG